MYQNEELYNAKVNTANCLTPDAIGKLQAQGSQPRRSTPKEEAEKEVYYMQEQVQKKQQAIAFLTANPAFDEFIMLIRKGVIQI